jgi:deoxyribodipyrimidine photo-lyase
MPAHDTPPLVWFRQDLRLADNAALAAAAQRRGPIVALYVLDEKTPGDWRVGGAAKWWLHHSLHALAASLSEHRIQLVLRNGRAEAVVPGVAAEIGAGAVFWNRCYEPFAIERDTRIKLALKDAGMEAESFSSALLAEPWTVKTQAGGSFKVFTPFWNALRSQLPPERPARTPTLQQTKTSFDSDQLDDWSLLPAKPNWAKGFDADWVPGEAGAQEKLKRFLADGLEVKSRSARFGMPPTRMAATRPKPICASSAGATLPIICCGSFTNCRKSRSRLASPTSPGATIRRR